jgi:hypothetical protein
LYHQSEKSVNNIIKNLKNTFKSIDIRLLLIKGESNPICNFAIIRLSNKDQYEIKKIHKDTLSNHLKKNPNAEILFFSKPIKSINQILKDLQEGRIRYRKNIFPLKDKKSFSSTSKMTEYPLNNDFWEYSSFISDDSNVQIILEKQIGKYVFGCDNNMLNKFFDYDLNRYLCFIIKIPLYCLISKSDKDVKIFIHKNLVSNIITHIQGRATSGKPIYDKVNLKDKIEKEEDFEEYSIDLSNYSLDDFHEQKMILSHSKLDRIYEFKLNIPTIKETELNWSESEERLNNNQELENNFLKSLSEFISIDTHTDTYYLIDNFNFIQIFPQQRNNLINYNFNDKYYRNLIFQINFSWRLGLFLSTLILSRKLIENLIIELLRKKFPSSNAINLYFNIKERRFHDFSILLENLKVKKNSFIPDINEIDRIIQMAQPFRKGANSATHHPFENPDGNEILKLKISEIVESILRIYCKTNIPGNMVSYTL